jgi:hypothetical protein
MLRRLLISLVCLTTLTGCSLFKKEVHLHPVTDQDIRMQDGWVCMSQDYIKNVMKVKLEEK